jgi:hypothetical protein
MPPRNVKPEAPVNAALRLQQEQALRACDMAQKTAQVCMQPPRPGALSEALALGDAAMTRAADLQMSWVRAWADWARFAGSISGADTTAKYADRMGNIVLRAEAQITSQVTEASELADNIGISYAYWLTRQLEGGDQRRSTSTEPTE